MISLDECQGVWKGINKFREMPKAEKLDFMIDDRLMAEISTAKQQYHQNCSDIDIVHATFDGFGKSILRSHKYHPEAFTQIALQLAYYRMHGQPAPTYCTASTRQYYHGRTETCRSCFPEVIDFVKAMVQDCSSVSMRLCNAIQYPRRIIITFACFLFCWSDQFASMKTIGIRKIFQVSHASLRF